MSDPLDICQCYECIERRGDVDEKSGFPVTWTRMIVCPRCGNKRCPRGTSHERQCTGSNESGQPGSRYR